MVRVMRVPVFAVQAEVLRDASQFYTSAGAASCRSPASLQLEQLQPLYLAGRTLGQCRDEAQQARRLVAAELRQTMRVQFCLVAARAGLEDNAREDVLTVVRVGNAHRRRLE